MDELTSLSSDPNLWNDAAKAQKLMSEKNTLEENLTNFQEMERNLQDLSDLAEMAEAENDEATIQECLQQLNHLKEQTKRGELEALLCGEVDANDAFLEVHSGSGGTEAQDWAEMLLRMYTRWAEDHHYKVEKNTQQNVTTTQVRELNGIERQEEIARMLAGETVTQEARAAAKVLLSA